MDQELIAYLDERFRESARQTQEQFSIFREEIARQFAASREEANQRFERLEEEVRHNGIEIEGLRGEIRQVAEGVTVANERLGRFKNRFTKKLKDVQTEARSLVRAAFEEIDVLKTQGFGISQQTGKDQQPDEV